VEDLLGFVDQVDVDDTGTLHFLDMLSRCIPSLKGQSETAAITAALPPRAVVAALGAALTLCYIPSVRNITYSIFTYIVV
jgi:hypothetical protein